MTSTFDETPLHETATLTRRGFVKTGGVLVAMLVWRPRFLAGEQAVENTPDPIRLSSWLEIRSDNTVLARTGKAEMGTGTTGQYIQVVAEELYIRPESVSLVMGGTDVTPDGGFAAGSLWGSHNLRKVAAYTYQALLTLASSRLGVPRSQLTAENGVIKAGDKSVTYGDLVRGQELDLKLKVKGILPKFDPARGGLLNTFGLLAVGPEDPEEPWPPQQPSPRTPPESILGPWNIPRPPQKPVSQYTVVGKPFQSPAIRDKVLAKTEWLGDVRLPGMLHARMVRPATVGSTLITVGPLDRQKFPNAQVVTRGNLVAVVSPNEWEAISAARAVAAGTKWTEWAGLPGSESLPATIRAYPREKPSIRGDVALVERKLASSAKVVSASYGGATTRHAPIAGYCAVAEWKNGQLTVWSNSAQPQAHRAYLAHAFGVRFEKVIVKWLDQAGQYGRVTMGGDGAEADAAILAQIVGKPVRVQWTLSEDLTWSSLSPGWEAEVKAGLDASGNLSAIQIDYCMPSSGDPRMLGAILAGLPSMTPSTGVSVGQALWLYDKVPCLERTVGMPNIGSEANSPGLRGNIMRSPTHRQPAFAVEEMMSSTAAAAGVDPVTYRIRHTTDRRLIELLQMTAEAAGWQRRAAPGPQARKTGSTPVIGQGVGVVLRANGYFVAIADVEVTPSTGRIRVTKVTVGADVGKVINPRQLELMARGGIVMGLSETLKEEVVFDRSKVLSNNWNRYKILTMEETPDIKFVCRSHDDRGFGAGGECINCLPVQAVTSAFFDATGVHARRIPLTPAYVKSLLSA